MSEWTLKRLAWAYGCAKKGSDEEREYRSRLVRAVATDLQVASDCTTVATSPEVGNGARP